jgi:hypothetical protein
MSIRFRRAVVASAFGFCGSLPVLFIPLTASAALGGNPMTPPAGASATTRTVSGPTSNGVAVLRSASSASSGATASSTSSSSSAGYTVTETTLGNGTVIREYASSGGSVFGLAWSGPQMPDLSNLLGGYFPQYVAGVTNARQLRGGGHGPGHVKDSGLVVHSAGHMGAFSGQAYLPQALPAGVSATDIK